MICHINSFQIDIFPLGVFFKMVLMLILKLKLQYFGHLMQRINSLEKTLLLGRIESGKRRR